MAMQKKSKKMPMKKKGMHKMPDGHMMSDAEMEKMMAKKMPKGKAKPKKKKKQSGSSRPQAGGTGLGP